MSDIQAAYVPADQAFNVWPKVRPYMAASAEYTYGRFDAEDILEQILNGEQLLWVTFDPDEMEVLGAVTTNFVTYPKKRALCMHFCGGHDLKDWKAPMLAILRRWARENECDVIESSGRPGWAKALKHDGHKALWHTYELPVDGGDDG